MEVSVAISSRPVLPCRISCEGLARASSCWKICPTEGATNSPSPLGNSRPPTPAWMRCRGGRCGGDPGRARPRARPPARSAKWPAVYARALALLHQPLVRHLPAVLREPPRRRRRVLLVQAHLGQQSAGRFLRAAGGAGRILQQLPQERLADLRRRDALALRHPGRPGKVRVGKFAEHALDLAPGRPDAVAAERVAEGGIKSAVRQQVAFHARDLALHEPDNWIDQQMLDRSRVERRGVRPARLAHLVPPFPRGGSQSRKTGPGFPSGPWTESNARPASDRWFGSTGWRRLGQAGADCLSE